MPKFWSVVHTQAIQATRRLLGLESVAAIVIRALITIAIVAALMLWGSDDAANDEMIFRSVAAGLVILLAPFVYAGNFVRFLPAPARASHEKLTALEGHLAALKSQKANLVIELQQAAYGGYSNDTADSVFAVFLAVLNKGSLASAAIKWGLRMSIGGDVYVFPPHYANYVTFATEHGDLTWKRKDSILEKTLNPIPVGGMATGYFFALIPMELGLKIAPNDTFTLFCEQVDGTPIEATCAISDKTDASLGIMAGMDPSFDKPKADGSDSL
jgi:hypothetical protein